MCSVHGKLFQKGSGVFCVPINHDFCEHFGPKGFFPDNIIWIVLESRFQDLQILRFPDSQVFRVVVPSFGMPLTVLSRNIFQSYILSYN